jgi:hypothetical protein
MIQPFLGIPFVSPLHYNVGMTIEGLVLGLLIGLALSPLPGLVLAVLIIHFFGDEVYAGFERLEQGAKRLTARFRR